MYRKGPEEKLPIHLASQSPPQYCSCCTYNTATAAQKTSYNFYNKPGAGEKGGGGGGEGERRC